MNKKIFSTIAFLIIACATGVFAQSRVLTADDYARAEKALGYNTGLLVDRGAVRPVFLPDGRFWYRVMTPSRVEFNAGRRHNAVPKSAVRQKHGANRASVNEQAGVVTKRFFRAGVIVRRQNARLCKNACRAGDY